MCNLCVDDKQSKLRTAISYTGPVNPLTLWSGDINLYDMIYDMIWYDIWYMIYMTWHDIWYIYIYYDIWYDMPVDRLIFECTILQNERERLIGKISRHDNWPVNKSQLGNKYIKQFIQFTNTVDFTKLWAYKSGGISAYKLWANKCI
jgi:hypothetical protein